MSFKHRLAENLRRGPGEGSFYLKKLDLSNQDLRGVDFRMACIRGCSFNAADLRDADFTFAFVEDCDFADADVRGAQFFGCIFVNVSMNGTRMQD